jgi:aminobenzoyl-glutamate utilization protein B
MTRNTAEETATRWLEENAAKLSKWTSDIWHLAETAWREYESAAWYVACLRAEGFEVEAGSGGMPTAFAASWTNGVGGPAIATYAEYDAVPGNCQAASTVKAPRTGLNEARRRPDRPEFRAWYERLGCPARRQGRYVST